MLGAADGRCGATARGSRRMGGSAERGGESDRLALYDGGCTHQAQASLPDHPMRYTPRVRVLEDAHDNVRIALGWDLTQDNTTAALDLSRTMVHFWATRGYYAEGVRWLARSLQSAGEQAPERSRADAAYGMGVLYGYQGKFADARKMF